MDRPTSTLLCASCAIGGLTVLGLATSLIPVLGQGLIVAAGVAAFAGVARIFHNLPIRMDERPRDPPEEEPDLKPPSEASRRFERFLSIVEGDGDEED